MKQARMRWGVTLLVLLVLLGSSPGAHSQEKQLPVGETLEYQVYAKGLPVGEQTLRIVGERVYQNRPVLEVRMSLKSYAALAFFSPMRSITLYLDWANRLVYLQNH